MIKFLIMVIIFALLVIGGVFVVDHFVENCVGCMDFDEWRTGDNCEIQGIPCRDIVEKPQDNSDLRIGSKDG